MSSSNDFHDKPFDEGTLTKLQILELYARAWLPVFLARPDPFYADLHLFDFFAGPGTDPRGELGSPLRLLRQLDDVRTLPGWSHVKVHVHFSDASAEKVEALKRKIDELGVSGIEFDIQELKFEDAFARSLPILRSKKAAKLLVIDQCGVSHVTPEVFDELVKAPVCDFLFFISSSTLHRFRDHPAIKQKIERPDDHYHVHRAAADYYRSRLPVGTTYHLAPFSIRKGANIYGLIFGSAHALGIAKFLEVAWSADELNGEADFNIHRDNIMPGQSLLFGPTKLSIFEEELERLLRLGAISDERDVLSLCFRHGVLARHAEPVLARLKGDGVISLAFRVAQVRNFKTPRPINKLK